MLTEARQEKVEEKRGRGVKNKKRKKRPYEISEDVIHLSAYVDYHTKEYLEGEEFEILFIDDLGFIGNDNDFD